jgi:hypothetical protein
MTMGKKVEKTKKINRGVNPEYLSRLINIL